MNILQKAHLHHLLLRLRRSDFSLIDTECMSEQLTNLQLGRHIDMQVLVEFLLCSFHLCLKQDDLY